MVPGIGEWLYTRLRKDPQAAYATLRAYYGELEALPEADRAFLFQRVNERVWSTRQRRAFLSIMRHIAVWLPKVQRGLADRLAHLTVPTLVLFGERDQIVSPKSGPGLTKVQPSAELVVVPEAGHQVQQERPEALLRALRDDERLSIQLE
jgi:pimeloyl-ACP methyl ester carboxylesterase